MIPGLQLRHFGLGGDWRPLLSRLEGWRSVAASIYSDGESFVSLSASSEVKPSVGFVLAEQPPEAATEHLLMAERLRGRVGIPGLELQPNSSLRRKSSELQPRFLMNHAAFQVPDVNSARASLEEFLGDCTILARASTWDPVARTSWPDAHLFRPPDFYITLKGGFVSSRVDHVGWMTDSVAAVDHAAALLGRLHWPILFGPTTLDGSYLVHFRGPDSLIHDFFFPTDSIVSRVKFGVTR
jgi:hypothetical protein